MRILWLAPWFSTLAVAWANGLDAVGHEVMVVTTPMHFEAPPLRERDMNLTRTWRSVAGVSELYRVRRQVRSFRPEVVVSESARDPRFLALIGPDLPLVLITHDHQPHDEANAIPLMRGWSRRVLLRRCTVEVTFSPTVAALRDAREHPVLTVPLTSEMPGSLAPPLVPAEGRHDFVVVGRLSAYKNLAMVIKAFREHQRSASYRGDRLVIIGEGDPGCLIPADVEWLRGRFRFSDVAPRLAAAKASLCLYKAGSQSGVQVLSMQCGTACLVSPVGGLASYLPRGETATPLELTEIASALNRYADPEEAAEAGARNRAEFESRLAVAPTSLAWENVLLWARSQAMRPVN